MGIDVRLIPAYNVGADFSLDSIELDRDYEMFDLIREVKNENGREVPRLGITAFLDKGYKKLYEDAYGDTIVSVQAGKLKKKLANYKADGWKNKAIIAFINELPYELEIWIYWH